MIRGYVLVKPIPAKPIYRRVTGLHPGFVVEDSELVRVEEEHMPDGFSWDKKYWICDTIHDSEGSWFLLINDNEQWQFIKICDTIPFDVGGTVAPQLMNYGATSMKIKGCLGQPQ